jgi:hypothetical protein
MNANDLAKLPERIASRIEPAPPSGCWLWMGACNSHGYGHAGVARKTVTIHRLVYETVVGPVPMGLTLDHLCRVRPCCDPRHMEAVTMRENLLRGESPMARMARRVSCEKCGGALGYINKGAPWSCRPCHRRAKHERNVVYRLANRESLMAKEAAFRSKHRSLINQKAAVYRATHRAEINARQRVPQRMGMAATSAAERGQ